MSMAKYRKRCPSCGAGESDMKEFGEGYRCSNCREVFDKTAKIWELTRR